MERPAPVDITFSRLTYTIQGSRDAAQYTLLDNVSGSCVSSRLTSILGPSGAGKTTLLKVLACCISGGKQQGSLLVNDQPVHPKLFRQQLAVVWQRDILLPTATVREAIMTSALLRLPRTMPRALKAQRVEQILSELDLVPLGDALIGQDVDGAVSGISGGERRRVSVGISLVTDARALFLDEPTTGLDSESAESLVGVLARMASSRGKTVLCTIHQPSSDVCAMFDDLLLLAKGRLLYCGPWASADEYFWAAGFRRLPYKSVAEHLLCLCKSSDSAVPLLADLQLQRWEVITASKEVKLGRKSDRRHREHAVLAQSKMSSIAQVKLGRKLTGASSNFEGVEGGKWPVVDIEAPSPPSVLRADDSSDVWSLDSPQTDNASCTSSAGMLDTARGFTHAQSKDVAWEKQGASTISQVAILSKRFVRTWIRSPVSMAMQAAQYLLAALLIGAMYSKLPNGVNAGVYNRVASLCISKAACPCLSVPSGRVCPALWLRYANWRSWIGRDGVVTVAGNNALNIACAEKPLLRREVHSGHYSYFPFYIAKCLTSLPLQQAYTAIFSLAAYFLVGYQAVFAKFATFWVLILLLGLISETLGLLCSELFRSQLQGAIVLQGLYVPLLMFVGFFQTHTPVYLEWVKELSFASYGYSALVKNEFEGLELSSGGVVVISDAVSAIPSNIESEHGMGVNIGVLLCILVGLRVVVYIQMCISIKLKFL
ncbi:Broad substrate specificity ATP-binding cassette transporter [Coccomyxa sp. Obi]|nr:Broad substrate specificity ATP-binding cassette transporter [Coccomyxa sp. Obi]